MTTCHLPHVGIRLIQTHTHRHTLTCARAHAHTHTQHLRSKNYLNIVDLAARFLYSGWYWTCENLVCVASTIGEFEHTEYIKMVLQFCQTRSRILLVHTLRIHTKHYTLVYSNYNWQTSPTLLVSHNLVVTWHQSNPTRCEQVTKASITISLTRSQLKV